PNWSGEETDDAVADRGCGLVEVLLDGQELVDDEGRLLREERRDRGEARDHLRQDDLLEHVAHRNDAARGGEGAPDPANRFDDAADCRAHRDEGPRRAQQQENAGDDEQRLFDRLELGLDLFPERFELLLRPRQQPVLAVGIVAYAEPRLHAVPAEDDLLDERVDLLAYP